MFPSKCSHLTRKRLVVTKMAIFPYVCVSSCWKGDPKHVSSALFSELLPKLFPIVIDRQLCFILYFTLLSCLSTGRNKSCCHCLYHFIVQFCHSVRSCISVFLFWFHLDKSFFISCCWMSSPEPLEGSFYLEYMSTALAFSGELVSPALGHSDWWLQMQLSSQNFCLQLGNKISFVLTCN